MFNLKRVLGGTPEREAGSREQGAWKKEGRCVEVTECGWEREKTREGGASEGTGGKHAGAHAIQRSGGGRGGASVGEREGGEHKSWLKRFCVVGLRAPSPEPLPKARGKEVGVE